METFENLLVLGKLSQPIIYVIICITSYHGHPSGCVEHDIIVTDKRIPRYPVSPYASFTKVYITNEIGEGEVFLFNRRLHMCECGHNHYRFENLELVPFGTREVGYGNSITYEQACMEINIRI